METRKAKQKVRRVYSFKSYYVVWKQFRVGSKIQGLQQFKSYYVVWKQIGEKKYKYIDSV